MTNKTRILDDIDTAINELDYVRIEVEDLKVDEYGEIDTSLIIKYIDDVKDAINQIRDNFEEYDEEVSDIEDDLEGLVARLSKVIE